MRNSATRYETPAADSLRIGSDAMRGSFSTTSVTTPCFAVVVEWLALSLPTVNSTLGRCYFWR